MTIGVAPKKDGQATWEWHIKDTEHRTLPLVANLVHLLVEHQMSQPEGNPYIFAPMDRYQRIQQLCHAGKWTVAKGQSPPSKFYHHFTKIPRPADIETGTFHNLRRTCLSNWVIQGLSLREVKELAGRTGIGPHEMGTAVREQKKRRIRSVSPASTIIGRAPKCAADMCHIAAGRFGAYYEPGLKSWDVAAAMIIVEEAGGKVSDTSGNPLSLFSTPDMPSAINVLATKNSPIHQRMIRLLISA